MSHVFISYSTKNSTYAYKLAQKLREEGFNVWIDNAQLRSSDNWWESIVHALHAAGAFIVVMTPESRRSRWVQREVTLADNWQIPAFPLLLNGDNFEIYVLTQYRDVRNGQLPPPEFYENLEQHSPRIKTTGNDITGAFVAVNPDDSVKEAIANPPDSGEESWASKKEESSAPSIGDLARRPGQHQLDERLIQSFEDKSQERAAQAKGAELVEPESEDYAHEETRLQSIPLLQAHWRLMRNSGIACALSIGGLMTTLLVVFYNGVGLYELGLLLMSTWFLQGIITARYVRDPSGYSLWWYIRSGMMGGPLNFLIVGRIYSKWQLLNIPITFLGWPLAAIGTGWLLIGGFNSLGLALNCYSSLCNDAFAIIFISFWAFLSGVIGAYFTGIAINRAWRAKYRIH